jgi:hypothetical protein
MADLSPTERSVRGSLRRIAWKRAESFLVAAFVMACLAGLVLSTTSDPDLWGHVTFGHDIVRLRAVTGVDSYSFTTDRPWINHEWLSEVLMYLSYATFGAAGLIALKVLVCGAAAILIVRQLGRSALTLEVKVFLFLLAVVGTKAQTGQVRPQLFSTLLFALLLSALTTVDDGDTRALFTLPLIFLFWANLHGGWILGAGVLGIWTAAQVLDSRRAAADLRNIVIAAVASAAATLVNPFGVGLWTFLLRTVRVDRADITDWQPVTYSTDILIVWLAIAATCGVFLFRARRIPSFFTATTLGVLAVGSFRVLRLESFFALSAVMLLPRALTPVQAVGASASSPKVTPVSRRAGLVVIGLASCAIALFTVLIVRNGSCIPIDNTGAPEPAVASFVRVNNLRGRMITWFDWGEYAIWHFSPAIQVSIDGRRETAYSPKVVSSHLEFYRDHEPPGSTIADRLNADYVWVPKDLPVVSTLRARGWVPIFAGPISTMLSKKQKEGFSQQQSATESRRCFPGP